MKLYVVAISKKEAEDIADQIGHEKHEDAVAHLRDVKAPPTDPYYANQYRIYTVER